MSIEARVGRGGDVEVRAGGDADDTDSTPSYKKHVSADPVTARLPYGEVTKLAGQLWWKRYDVNSLVRVSGSQVCNISSTLRRAWYRSAALSLHR